MRHANWWWLSTIVSAVLVYVLINQWIEMNNYVVRHSQLVDEQAAEEYLRENWQKHIVGKTDEIEPMRKVRTGIFIQSLKFFNSTEVSFSGYIWQRYQDGIQDDIKPGKDEVGFILPEQIDSGGDVSAREVYRQRYQESGINGEVIGWYFEATLRQPFKYEEYPFDHKTAWVRMWHKDFWRNIVLVPDYTAYESTADDQIFGIEPNIVLGSWIREDTYFDYTEADYDTNFGIPDYIGQHKFPELRYNFVLKRNFENAFIIYLLPLFLVAMLLFAALLTTSNLDELSGRLGFNTSGFIGACSALFFVVLLAHIQLREQFGGAGIVYIEYFYILMYILLVLGTANVYLFTIRPKRWFGWILYEDNIIFKVAYWPVVLAALILITLGVM